MKLRQIRYVLPLLAFLAASSYGCSNKIENNPSDTGNQLSATNVKENVSNSESNNKEEASIENNPSGTDNPHSATSVKGNASNSESNNKEEASSEKFLSFSVLDESAKTCSVAGFKEDSTGGEPTDVVIPSAHDGYKVISIGDYAFWNKKIKSIKRQEGVETIGENAFTGCDNLSSVTLPSTITSLGRSSFSQCSSLAEISLPSSLESIGKWCFSYCSSLSSIAIPDKVKTIEEHTFEECLSLQNVTFGKGVETIGESAFYKNGIESLTLPGNIKTISARAFEKCESLTGVEFSQGLTTLGSLAFLNCSSLQEVVLPDSLTEFVSGSSSFGSGSQFEGCSSLSIVSLGKKMTTIPEERFRECVKLTKIYIPASVQKLEYHSLGYPTSVKDIYYGGSESQWNKVEIGEYDKNDITSSATIHYNSTGLPE